METRKLAAIVVSLCNALVDCLNEGVEMIEKELAKDKGDDTPDKSERSGRSSSERRKDAAKNVDKDEEKTSRTSRSSKKDDDDADDDDKDDDKSEGDEPSEDDVVDAARAALKVIDRSAVAKIIKKFGKAEKASEVEPDLRQKVIDELEKAVDAE